MSRRSLSPLRPQLSTFVLVARSRIRWLGLRQFRKLVHRSALLSERHFDALEAVPRDAESDRASSRADSEDSSADAFGGAPCDASWAGFAIFVAADGLRDESGHAIVETEDDFLTCDLQA